VCVKERGCVCNCAPACRLGLSVFRFTCMYAHMFRHVCMCVCMCKYVKRVFKRQI